MECDPLWFGGFFIYTLIVRCMDWYEHEQRDNGNRWRCALIGVVSTALSWAMMMTFFITLRIEVAAAAALGCGAANFWAANRNRQG